MRVEPHASKYKTALGQGSVIYRVTRTIGREPTDIGTPSSGKKEFLMGFNELQSLLYFFTFDLVLFYDLILFYSFIQKKKEEKSQILMSQYLTLSNHIGANCHLVKFFSSVTSNPLCGLYIFHFFETVLLFSTTLQDVSHQISDCELLFSLIYNRMNSFRDFSK